MEEEKKEFLTVLEQAQKIKETLEKLHNEASSYKSATALLNNVNKEISKLIESMQKSTDYYNNLIDHLSKIGTPEIINSINGVESTVTKILTETKQEIKNILDKGDFKEELIAKDKEIIETTKNILEKLQNFRTSLDEKAEKNQNIIEKGFNDALQNLKEFKENLDNDIRTTRNTLIDRIGESEKALNLQIEARKKEIFNKLSGVEFKISKEFYNQNQNIKKLNNLVVANLIISITTIISIIILIAFSFPRGVE